MKNSTTAIELIITYMSIGWAMVMFTNPVVFKASENFNLINEIFQYPWVLGIIAVVVASVKILGILIQNVRVRWFGLVLSGIFWIAMASCFLVASGSIQLSTGFIAYSGVAVLALSASKDVMMSDRINKRSFGRKNKATKRRSL